MIKEKTFSQSNVALWGAVLLLFGLIIRVLLLETPLQSDDTTYLSIAKSYSAQFLQNANNQLPFRSGMIIPLILLQKIFGYSIATYYVFSVSSYMLMLLSIYLISIMVFGLPAGIASLCIAASSSLILYQSSNVLPDVPNLAFMLISFALFLLAERKNTGKNKGWAITLLIALSAMAGFWAYLVREANIVFLVCIPLYEVLKNRSIRRTMLFGMFFLVFVALEMSYYWVMTGNPLRRFAMVPQGVNLWVVYQPVISLGQYLFEPFALFAKWTTGYFLLLGGAIGLIVALFKKNWAMVSIVAGGMLLFIFYSYSATSLSPIKRALPLQIRYILPFSVVLAMSSGYAVTFIGTITRLGWRGRSLPIFGFLMLGFIVCLQVAELPRSISGAILNGNDSYFIADRLLRDRQKNVTISGPVYAYPAKDFQLYPNFRKLDLKWLDIATPPRVGQTILFSRHRMRWEYNSAMTKGDASRAGTAEICLNRFHPNWDILLDTEDITLAKVIAPVPTLKETIIFDLADSELLNVWASTVPNGLNMLKNGKSPLTFDLLIHDSPYYIYTFPGSFNLPPEGWEHMFKKFKAGDVVKFEVSYETEKNLNSLMIFISEYGGGRKGQMNSKNLDIKAGKHTYTDMIRLRSNDPSFRVFFRIDNNVANKINLYSLKVYKLSNPDILETSKKVFK